ncbi:MAG: enolase-phosphatase E1 [Trizodia sp. TS-e1964]|nr:MAG: enolase-phosphatase E1 [Trizodia sp. TS-e1964]
MQTDPTPQRERIHSILLDIEGTVCTISWVRDILIPHALALLPSILATEWDSPAFLPYRAAFPPAHRTSAAALLAHVRDLTARDTKASYLKSLQGTSPPPPHVLAQQGQLTCAHRVCLEKGVRKRGADGAGFRGRGARAAAVERGRAARGDLQLWLGGCAAAVFRACERGRFALVPARRLL